MCIWFQIQSLFWRRWVGGMLGLSSWAGSVLVAAAVSRPRQVPTAASSIRGKCIFPGGTDLGKERRCHQGTFVATHVSKQLPGTAELPSSVHSLTLHPLLVPAEPDSVPAPEMSSKSGRGRQTQKEFLLSVTCASVEASTGERRAQKGAAGRTSWRRGNADADGLLPKPCAVGTQFSSFYP